MSLYEIIPFVYKVYNFIYDNKFISRILLLLIDLIVNFIVIF